jgi:hypothetical protein
MLTTLAAPFLPCCSLEDLTTLHHMQCNIVNTLQRSVQCVGIIQLHMHTNPQEGVSSLIVCCRPLLNHPFIAMCLHCLFLFLRLLLPLPLEIPLLLRQPIRTLVTGSLALSCGTRDSLCSSSRTSAGTPPSCNAAMAEA